MIKSYSTPQVLHPKWFSFTAALLGVLFIFTSIVFWAFPQEMLQSIMGGFKLTGLDQDALEFAFLGNNVRNTVIGIFILVYAFRDTRTLVVLLLLRLCIEVFDLVGGRIYNPAIAETLPVFAIMIGLEAFLLYKGYQVLKKQGTLLEQLD